MDRLAEAARNAIELQGYEDIRAALHPHCVVCSPNHPGGLCLRFMVGADDTVVADFELDQTVEGYVGWPHGGITASILDGAMTNWLFAHGLTCVTAELKVRFRHPVLLDEPARVTASLKSVAHPLYVLEAHVMQNGQLKVRATGRFMYTQDVVGGL
ncbi:MAG: hypothetical protein A2Y76_12340 [Planctomycetes bacterium RBG_13_60_9]|nr:MAG: hypothetical protein A2Y76_12340 [Planctomycetes bacterium RBG_13_60_9]